MFSLIIFEIIFKSTHHTNQQNIQILNDFKRYHATALIYHLLGQKALIYILHIFILIHYYKHRKRII
jgi:hypothetical protein